MPGSSDFNDTPGVTRQMKADAGAQFRNFESRLNERESQLRERESLLRERESDVHPQILGPVPQGDSIAATLRALRRSWWIILICGIVAGGVGVAVTQTRPIRYQAQTYLLLAESGYQQAIAGGYAPADPQRQQATLNGLLTPALLQSAATSAGVRGSQYYDVTTQVTANSNVMQLVATTGNAGSSAALANATADRLRAFLHRTDAAQLVGARAVLRRQIRATRNVSYRRALVAQRNNLNTLQALSDQQMQIIQPASVPAQAVSPGTIRNGLIAVALGSLLGAALGLMRKPRAARPE